MGVEHKRGGIIQLGVEHLEPFVLENGSKAEASIVKVLINGQEKVAALIVFHGSVDGELINNPLLPEIIERHGGKIDVIAKLFPGAKVGNFLKRNRSHINRVVNSSELGQIIYVGEIGGIIFRWIGIAVSMLTNDKYSITGVKTEQEAWETVSTYKPNKKTRTPESSKQPSSDEEVSS